ncbi:hypothetical protein ABID99_000318 [Mucilaginibacter sp. OAE612]
MMDGMLDEETKGKYVSFDRIKDRFSAFKS